MDGQTLTRGSVHARANLSLVGALVLAVSNGRVLDGLRDVFNLVVG